MNCITSKLDIIFKFIKERKISKSKGEGRRGEVKKLVAPSPLSPSLPPLPSEYPPCLPIHMNILYISLKH